MHTSWLMQWIITEMDLRSCLCPYACARGGARAAVFQARI